MDEYRARVRLLASQRNGEPIYNASTDHASIIVETMFAHANEGVCIYSGGMNARVYGREEVVTQAKLFLSNPTHFAKIILESPETVDFREHPFFKAVCENNNVTVRVISSELSKMIKFHFLLMDNDSYRFETDKTTHVAVAAFGDAKGAREMATLFETLWINSLTLELHEHKITESA